MLRMLMSHLKVVNERYWYQEILYTGVGFERDEEGLVVGHHIREGIVEEVYSPICVPTPKALQKISSALAENPQKLLVPLVQMDCSDQFSDYNLDYLMKESSFSGIGYEFDEGYCRREALILKNNVCWDTYWYPDGSFLSWEVPTPFFHREYYEWYPDQTYETIVIEKKHGDYKGILRFSDTAHLTLFGASRNFLKHFPDVYAQARFFPFAHREGFTMIDWAEEVRLVGEDIDDDFITMMIESPKWCHLRRLDLTDTLVENAPLYMLKGLEALHIHTKNVSKHQAWLEIIKTNHPTLTIILKES